MGCKGATMDAFIIKTTFLPLWCHNGCVYRNFSLYAVTMGEFVVMVVYLSLYSTEMNVCSQNCPFLPLWCKITSL